MILPNVGRRTPESYPLASRTRYESPPSEESTVMQVDSEGVVPKYPKMVASEPLMVIEVIFVDSSFIAGLSKLTRPSTPPSLFA